MITNFKIFENTKLLYKKDDYVLLDLDQIEKNNKCENWFHIMDMPDDNMAQISDIDINNLLNRPANVVTKLPYIVKFYNGEIFTTKDDEIIRKLTDDEIEEYETKKDAKNFNL